MTLGSTHNGVDARDQLILMERFGHIVISTKAETFDLVLYARQTGKDEDRRFHSRYAQLAQHIETRHIRQVQVEQDDVVVIDLAKIDAFLAEIGRVNVEVSRLEHQLD